MKKVVIGFSRPSGGFKPFSWIIRLVERTAYSHVYIRSYSQSLGLDIIYQASGSQVNFVGLDRFYKHAKMIHEFEVEISDSKYVEFMRWSIINAGADYSIKQVLGILLVKLFNLKINPLSNGQNAWVCAELVEFFLNSFADIELDKNGFETAGPKRIYQICEKHAKKISEG